RCALCSVPGSQFVGDLCLHFNADRLLFSMPNTNNQWQVFEMGIDGAGVHQVTPGVEAGSGNYDACYLPNDDILFSSTVPRTSVPCVTGSIHVSNLFRFNAATGIMRQLCFDQEHNWTPRILPNGTVLYQRWEYTDTPHSNTRLLFTMNPDGTSQRAFYGSNSYWPTAFFYAQPIPGKANLVLGISSGHHGPARTGELILLDVGRGRYEADGVVQKIPGFGQKVEPRIYDYMDNVWPNFIHPCPLSEKYFLVSCRPSPAHNWGLYLVDVFDNLLLIQDFDDYAVLEPVAMEKRPVPPVLPDKVDLARKNASIYIQDIYEGGGLKGIPRGTVTSLRVFTYTFSYPNVGGLYGVIGMDGPWDMRRVLGTVPVEPDGSALFRAPANTPIAIQPLDKEGRALALMRSWMTAMPGENLSCVGCHERENSTPPSRSSLALKRQPSDLTPWRGLPVRGFSFEREVQPVLDRYCVSCHKPGGSDPDLEGGRRLTGWHSAFAGSGGHLGGKFSSSYANLFPFVRNNGIEGDYHLLAPMEFHFSTTDLGKLLRKGHYGVELDDDAWARLVTWADLNRPYHGTWSSIVGESAIKEEALRAEARRKYAGLEVNHEDPVPAETVKQSPVIPHPPKPVLNPVISIPGWPFDEARAKALQGSEAPLKLDLGNGTTMELVRIPAGEFAMGSATGHLDEQPVCRTRIAKPFWMARLEVSNGQYSLFDPSHDSGCADAICYQFGRRPWHLDQAGQPVCRVSWREAMAFCDWLSRKTRRKVTLPTEAQWEWACRAGAATPYSFGATNADYVPYANFGDKSLSRFAADTSAQDYHGIHVMEDPGKYDAYIPRDDVHNDGNQLSANPGTYKPNAWGLYDMHGNVAEWTRSCYVPYPYKDDNRNNPKADGRERVVRGGGWWSRPFMGTSSWRVPFADYQPVMEVGFRVIVEE
ncbi:MAG: SUMF1/EgtB/PvdO family nonheme iron enzyme, partial [bacterium]